MMRWRGVIEEYRKFLPVTDKTPVVTLGEGNTPLIHAKRLADKIAPGIELYVKFEGANPTGSFKDRGMTMAISKAVEGGAARRDLRLDRQYVGVCRRLWCACRTHRVRVDSRRKNCAG